MEGDLVDVTAAIKGVSAVYGTVPRFVPPTERGTLLSPRNPLSTTHSVCCGEWVRCLHGLYRGDVGLVCEVDSTSDASVIVAFLPRIPDRVPDHTATSAKKRKRWVRPTPRLWSASEVRAVWGDHRVQMVSDADEFEFGFETYRTGLLIKPLPPASIAVANAPDNIGLFTRSLYITTLPFFDSMAQRYAQSSILVGQRVKVISGEQRGLVGYMVDITNDVADVVQRVVDDTPPIHLQVPLTELLPVYKPGDHVKHMWSNTQGIVTSSDLDMVTFVDTRTKEEVRTYVTDIMVAN